MARRATTFLGSQHGLIVTDVIFAEIVYVLESFYERPRAEVAQLGRSLLAVGSIAADQDLLLRGLELYEAARLDFAEAYLSAMSEVSGIGTVASSDRTPDRVPSVNRVEP